ncbi:MAG TPA: excinuclease ABC subunit UvrC [Bacteroidota bacterium]|nr:excinuclease ABC subunit UvrC [Bacteroidota bacterium]
MNEQPTGSDVALSVKDLRLEEKLESLPHKPGVYQFKNADGKVIYVGKAQSLRGRVRQYFSVKRGSASGGQRSRSQDSKLDALIAKIADVELVVTDNEVEALILEANLIKKLRPRYNVDFKDDKSYPFIVITNEPFPRVFVTRKKVGAGARYFGPYTDVKTMRFALKTVRDIFMIRSCNYDLTEDSISAGKFKLCLDYHIKKCEGPCEGLLSKVQYNDMIAQVTQVLKGKTDSLVDFLHQEMGLLSDHMKFEDAARIRDRIRALEVYTERQKIIAPREVDRDIWGLVTKSDDACGVIFKVRDGKVVGNQHFYMGNVEGKEEGEVMENLIERFYMESEDIPPEVVLSTDVVSPEVVQGWLEHRRKGKVSIDVPRAGEKAKLVGMVKNNAQFWIDELEVQRLKRGDYIPHSVKSLQRDLRLSAPPRRIECFDISNIQGTDSVASMVVFVDGKQKKSEYRKFKIKTVTGADDFASMQEVVHRRYSRVIEENQAMPDLIMVDGGKGQLSSAMEILKKIGVETTPIIGLAKRLEEVFIPENSEPVMIPRTSSGLRLLQQVRDEAHRFAITYHRVLRAKRILRTELDLIKGIGKARATELLEAFGSVQGVKFATEEQLSEIVGSKTAQKIKEHFEEGSPSEEL